MKFSWQKDGSNIIFSSSITINTSGNMSTLILRHVSTTDAGSYTCTVSNDVGSVTSKAATLQVTGEYNELLYCMCFYTNMWNGISVIQGVPVAEIFDTRPVFYIANYPSTHYIIRCHKTSLNYIHDCSFIINSSFVHADTRQWRPLAFRLLRLASLLLVLATTLESESTASGFDITGAKSLPWSIDAVIATSCRGAWRSRVWQLFSSAPMPISCQRFKANCRATWSCQWICTVNAQARLYMSAHCEPVTQRCTQYWLMMPCTYNVDNVVTAE